MRIREGSMVETSRRGFLRGSMGAAVLGSACSHDRPRTEIVDRSDSATAAATAHHRVKVATTINGKAHELEVDPDESTLALVRDRIGLTGAKLGCGHGACGACTMHLDGEAVATCLLPATALAGRRVTTVEGLARAGALHPVQRAFMAEDALQCGYCTPGFVVEAAAFVDAWREHSPGQAPGRDAIAEALSGHLCRCGAYDAIHRAVASACKGEHDDADPLPARVDARAKVTGAARYTTDVRVPNRLVARALHSPHAHAKVTHLDWSKALAVPGVRAAIDLLGEARIVRFAGQEIMALAATDERALAEGLAQVVVRYDVRPGVFDLASARAEGAPVVYPRKQDRKAAPNAAEGPLLPEPWDGNVRGPLKMIAKHRRKAADVVADARKAGKVAEGAFATGVQCHTTLEPHAALAQWDGDDRLTVHLSTQAVSHMAEDIAQRWGLRRDDVRVIADYVGGGFGSKATLGIETVIAVELACVCQAPVAYALDRRAELMLGGTRPAAQVECALAFDDAGHLTAMRAVTHADSGVAVGHVASIMFRVMYHGTPRELEDYDVLTNTPPGRPFRGPGGPPAFWALEQMVDEVAHRRREDPLALRARWDPNPQRKPLYAWARALPVWRDRVKIASDRGRFRRGVGAACAGWFAFAEPKTRIEVKAGRDGVVASLSSQDMGNGTRTVIAEAIARELGIARAKVEVVLGDSRLVHGPMSAGSRTTSSVVPACIDACAQLHRELVEVAEDHFALKDAKAGRGGVAHSRGLLPWADVLAVAKPITVVGRRRKDEGGYFLPPFQGVAAEEYIAGGIQIVEVEVDTRLGKVRPIEVWGGYAIGRIVVPAVARSQAMGGIVQGLSYALFEERRLDPRGGYLLSAGLEDYRIAGIGDVPPMHVHFEEGGYDRVPGRQVGLGELVTIAPAAALGNAIFHATGKRMRTLPLRPDRVLKELQA
ncbi:MAG TPA: molybdopterin-dependent oxidoreductase [Nannocystaceae bacterium]|nr:molybdopterin-dependent oxidoreductase [Nannocystaceae bacterium]